MNSLSSRVCVGFTLCLMALGAPGEAYAGHHGGGYRQTTTVRTHGTPPVGYMLSQPTIATFQPIVTTGLSYQPLAPTAPLTGGYYYYYLVPQPGTAVATTPPATNAPAPAPPPISAPPLLFTYPGTSPSGQAGAIAPFDPVAASAAFPAMTRVLGSPLWIGRVKSLLTRSAQVNLGGLKAGGITKDQIISALELAAQIALGSVTGSDLSLNSGVLGEITTLVGQVVSEVLGGGSASAPAPPPVPGGGVSSPAPAPAPAPAPGGGTGIVAGGGTQTIQLQLPTSLRLDVYHHQVPAGAGDTSTTTTPPPTPGGGIIAPPPAQPPTANPTTPAIRPGT